MKQIAKKTILNVKPYVPGKPIDEVKRELGLRRVIKLASNENPYGPSSKVLKAMQGAVKNVNRYPDGGCFYLRQTLAKQLKLSPDQLIFGNGSDELIVLAVRAFVNPGDEVIIADPSFLIYDIASRIAGAKIKAVALKNFRYDLASMKNQVSKKTKIVFLGNPDNPSGQYFTTKEIQGFFKGLNRDILVFIDEAYYEYVTASDYVDSVKLLKMYKNLFITRTFSKMYGLAGLRVGYGMGNKELIDILNRIREPFNVNSVAQAAAIACLKDKSHYQRLAKTFEAQRKIVCKALDKLGLIYVDSCTNFILVNVKRDSSLVCKKLLKKGVIVRDMGFWKLKNFIRVTIGTDKENKILIKTLESVL